MVAWRDDEGPDEGAAPTAKVVRRRARAWRATQWALIAFGILLIAALAGVWFARKPIANDIIARELEKRGVQATYKLDRIGLRTQQISNLVIGDPANPDLTARVAQVQMRLKLNGSVEVFRIAARGVRLRGKIVGRKVSWGQIDKLLPPPSGKPFTLPNIVADVADTTIRLDSPYGRMGFAVAGRGNLSGGFKGHLSAAAPRLKPGRCQLDDFAASVALRVEARHPIVRGPIGARAFACPASRLSLAQPRMEIDSRFTEAFGSFDGKGRLSFASLVSGTNGLANATSQISFKGTPTEIRGSIDLAAQRARLASILADRTRLNGRYRLDATRGGLDLSADYAADGVALGSSMSSGITNTLDAARKTPIGPIATAIANAIRNAGKRLDVSGHLLAVNRAGGGGVRIETADARSATGAQVQISRGDGVTYYWPSGRLRVDGDIRMQGGGLPNAFVSLSQPRSGAPMSGRIVMAPYAAGGSRLALAPVRFAAQRDGSTQVDTIALLDGPFSGGRVTGLRLPISARFGGRAGLRVGNGCIDARFTSLRFGSLALGPTRLPLCPTRGPAFVMQAPGGSLLLGVAARNLNLNGRLGRSPFRLSAAEARMLDSQRFSASSLAVRLGRNEAPVLLDARTLAGTFDGRGVNGTFGGGKAIIGRVPLLLSDATGKWRVYNGDLTLDGGLTVAHRADPPLFYPLVSNNVHLTLADDWIRATGTLNHPRTGTRVTDVTIAHRLSSGAGTALLDVPGIRFDGGLQPEDLTRLTEGVIALVTGNLNGEGRIAWNGSGEVSSTGQFNIVNTDLAAPFGPVTGLNTTINFTDLLGLETGPGQSLSVASINPGILVQNGIVRYQLLPDRLVKIERGEWPFMGGRLILRETILNFNKPTPKRLTFEVVGLDARTFVGTMGFKEIDASGVFDGVLPMIFDDQGGRIVGGRLDSRPPGGTLAYNGVVNRANLGMFGNLAFDALRNLRYRSMIIRLDGFLDGEFATRLTIDEVALGEATKTQRFIKAINRIPFKFNVTIKGPFRALIATAKSFRDPQQVISDVVPLADVPGIVTEVRRTEEQQQQSQTPVPAPVVEPEARQ